MTVLGSREQFCIHDEVSLLKGRMQSNACRFLRRRPVKKQSEEQDEEQHKKRCQHYSCVSGILTNIVLKCVLVVSIKCIIKT